MVFERDGLRPVAPAIVWQCRRSAAICAEHRERGEEDALRERTGLLLDPYFTATKLEWLLADQPELRARAERGELCAGTVDTWLVARLSGGAALVTDASNASRTLLYDLRRGGVRRRAVRACSACRSAVLPEVRDSAGQGRPRPTRRRSSACACRSAASPATSRPRSSARRACARG